AGTTPRHGTPPSPLLVVRSSNWRLGRESPCTTRWVCDWAAPPGASAVPRCPAAGCRSPEAESHISLPVLPVLRRSPVWETPHRFETPPPCSVPVDARFLAEAFRPSLRHCARCPVATSHRDSLLLR